MSDYTKVPPSKVRQTAYAEGYQQGRADMIDECIKTIVNTESKVVNPVASKSWDVLTILADRQNEILEILKTLKEQKNGRVFRSDGT